jgi:hypothetical protein
VSPLYMKMSLLRVSGLEQSAQASSVWLPCSPSGSASKKKEPGDGRGHFSLRNRFGPERKWVLVRIHFGPDWWSAAPRTSAGSRSTHGFLFSRSRQSTAHHPNRGWLGLVLFDKHNHGSAAQSILTAQVMTSRQLIIGKYWYS